MRAILISKPGPLMGVFLQGAWDALEEKLAEEVDRSNQSLDDAQKWMACLHKLVNGKRDIAGHVSLSFMMVVEDPISILEQMNGVQFIHRDAKDGGYLSFIVATTTLDKWKAICENGDKNPVWTDISSIVDKLCRKHYRSLR